MRQEPGTNGFASIPDSQFSSQTFWAFRIPSAQGIGFQQ